MRGINRNVVVMRTDKGSRFETVYFVLKKGTADKDSDILDEANRIIRENAGRGSDKKFRKILRELMILLGGLLLGALSSAAVFLWLSA